MSAANETIKGSTFRMTNFYLKGPIRYVTCLFCYLIANDGRQKWLKSWAGAKEAATCGDPGGEEKEGGGEEEEGRKKSSKCKYVSWVFLTTCPIFLITRLSFVGFPLFHPQDWVSVSVVLMLFCPLFFGCSLAALFPVEMQAVAEWTVSAVCVCSQRHGRNRRPSPRPRIWTTNGGRLRPCCKVLGSPQNRHWVWTTQPVLSTI